MSKVGICGNFKFNSEVVGGQTIKTRIISKILMRHYGSNQVINLDSDGWQKNPLVFLFKCISMAIKSDNIIILPAMNGIRVLIPLFVFLSKLFNKKVHYIVVGAWLAKNLQGKSFLINQTKKIDYIYPQTKTLLEKLDEMGISQNTYIMPNFKEVDPVEIDTEDKDFKKPLKLCIVSRVNYEKGVESAIQVIDKLNKEYNENIVILDIYGPIENSYEEKFKNLLKKYEETVRYKGIVDHNKMTETIKEYFILLFPTKYYTEGFPGTILDAYLSGVPVLASRWESWKDVIDEGITGFTFEFDNDEDFYEQLKHLVKNEEKVREVKKNCLIEADKYKAENAIKILINNIS